jgi:hypothetical protein
MRIAFLGIPCLPASRHSSIGWTNGFEKGHVVSVYGGPPRSLAASGYPLGGLSYVAETCNGD